MTYSNNKSTTYVYDATGRKLQVEYVNPATTFDYCGNVIYVNDRLYRILVDGGYIEPYEGEMYYSYYLKDHQGNNRVVAYDNGIVSEVNHYYPFGLLFGESKDPETQKFKYNGKEYDRNHGLDMYDYGARFYDPGICRFTTMDPMCEKYYHLSPYIYCGNNPVNYVDPDGKDDYEINQDGYIKNITSFWEKIKTFFGYSNGNDRIFIKGNNNPILTFPEGTIVKMKNGSQYSKFEISDKTKAEEAFKAIISNSDVEWALVRHIDTSNSGSSLIVNNHKDQDVSISATFADMYKKRGEYISLFEHSHPLQKDYRKYGIPNIPFYYPPSPEDVLTAKEYPNTKLRVYDVYNKKVYEYNKNGIKKIWKW